jgi:NADPH-dependent ferric siderophore reductase
MHRPDHATHTAETAHHDDRVQYVVVGDESSLTDVEAELSILPLCARGRVFVEVDDASLIVPIAAPLRMTVTWLTRGTRSGRPGTGERCARGEAATRAVRAWAAEMLCDGPGSTRAVVTGGFDLVSDVRELLLDEVGMPSESVLTPPSSHRRSAA